MHVSSQQEQIPGTVANSAGGYSFSVDNWEQFKRFLILGTTGGTYYISEKELTKDNLDAVRACIHEDGKRAVDLIVQVSHEGRAPKNDPAIFALALAVSAASPDTRAYALQQLSRVCRTFTHVSHFMTFVRQGNMRGMGPQFCRALAAWFDMKPVPQVVNQLIKYGSRDGYSQKDVYRLAHPRNWSNIGQNTARDVVYKRIVTDKPISEDTDIGGNEDEHDAIIRLIAHDVVQKGQSLLFSSEYSIPGVVKQHKLPMESVPTDKRTPEVYAAVIPHSGITWLLRNLGNIAKHDLNQNTVLRKLIAERLTDRTEIKNGRLHPLNIFVAMKTYSSGTGVKGSGKWTPHRDILDALDFAFYESFVHLPLIEKRILYAVDTSASMTALASGTPNVKCTEAAAVMAMAAAKVTSEFDLIGFDTSIEELNGVSHRQRLDDIVKEFGKHPAGTDCSLPFKYARDKRREYDLIVSFTDSETWAGKQHPLHAFDAYKQAGYAPKCKAVNVAMTANHFTVLPVRPDTLEIVGFDTTVPEAISLFANS